MPESAPTADDIPRTFRTGPSDPGPGPSGTTMAIASMPHKEVRIIRRRIDELHAERTVDGSRDLIEAR